MKETNTILGSKLGKQRCLLLLALAVFLVSLSLAFAVKPAYADDPGTETITPGEGGGGMDSGGGGGVPPFTYKIEGYVWNRKTGTLAGAGIQVFLYYGAYTWSDTTDAYGYFSFYAGVPNGSYQLTVNGDIYNLGSSVLDARWGQWRGIINTDNVGYGFRHIHLEPASVVNVPAAALFSNTQYATLYYGTQTSTGFSHSLNFRVPIIGISTGYKTSESVAYTALFWSSPNHAQFINRPYYAPTYFDDLVGDVASTGIAKEVPNTDWGGLSTHEYLNETRLPTTEYVDFPVPPGGKDWTYQETGSQTWSASLDVPFAIVYQAFGKVINLETTVSVTSGTTTWVRYRIENPTENDIYFRVYTPGAQPNQNNGIGGMELHIWEI